jgi:hypothetical protein
MVRAAILPVQDLPAPKIALLRPVHIIVSPPAFVSAFSPPFRHFYEPDARRWRAAIMDRFDTLTMSNYLAGGATIGPPDSIMLPMDTVSNFDNETFFG